jgi:RIO kinase 2
VIDYKDDGYTLSYFGYDFLALKVFLKRGSIKGLSAQIDVGKESDIYLAFDNNNNHIIIKFTQ